MELDEMKLAWQALNQRLEQQQALNLQLFRDHRLDKSQRKLRPLWWGQLLQIAGGVLVMITFAPFWVEHRDSLHLMLCGLMLHAYGLMLVLTAARNLHLQSELDYTAPVVEIQRRLAALKAWRLREALLYGVTGCFIWIPLLLVGFEYLGADLWVDAPLVVWGNIASGVACLGLLYGILRWSQRPGWERLRKALINSSIGRSVLNTQAMLDELARFEKD
jgi:hypothetical protein